MKSRAEEVAIGRCRRPDESLEASDGLRVYGDALAHMVEAVLFLSCRGFSLLFHFSSLPSLAFASRSRSGLLHHGAQPPPQAAR
jgi:hypothetical protein